MIIALIVVALFIHVLAYALCRTAAEADAAMERRDGEWMN